MEVQRAVANKGDKWGPQGIEVISSDSPSYFHNVSNSLWIYQIHVELKTVIYHRTSDLASERQTWGRKESDLLVRVFRSTCWRVQRLPREQV